MVFVVREDPNFPAFGFESWLIRMNSGAFWGSELKLFCIMTCVTPCIRTSVTVHRSDAFRWEGSQGARRATVERSQRNAVGPAPACNPADGRSPARTCAGS